MRGHKEVTATVERQDFLEARVAKGAVQEVIVYHGEKRDRSY